MVLIFQTADAVIASASEAIQLLYATPNPFNVVPANAGTHTPRPFVCKTLFDD
jgi:hypothetical protein